MRFAVVLMALGLANCAGVVEGTSQKISVNTDPSGATCRFDRAGQQLGVIPSTPGDLIVKPKSADNIVITCEKPGFQQASYLNKSDTAAATFGNILLGGVIGAIADQQTGAAYKYDGTVTVTLAPAAAPLQGSAGS